MNVNVAGADTFIDAVGQRHRPHRPTDGEPRIVSLVPSVTELVCALGLSPYLVGRTGFCIHPADTLAAVPKVGGTKDVNIEKIRRLAPTHLLVNIDENEKPTVEQLAGFVPNVIVTHPVAPRDNLALYRLIGGLFGADAAAESLCAAFEREYAQTKASTVQAKRVLYCIWQDPWMTVSCDTYIARMLELERRYPEFRWSEALASEIDEVLLSSEPYRFTETHADALERQLGKPVRLVDGEMMSWYGSRAIDGLRYLRELAQD